MTRTDQQWWTMFFDESYGEWGLAGIDEDITTRSVAFLWDRLGLGRASRVFDQCCGIGRISIPLAARGAEVVGVDITEAYITAARSQAKRHNVMDQCEFYCADGFQFVSPRPCDAAINWFTSFGYGEDDEQNVLMLRCVFDSLAGGGLLALDLQNIPRIMRDFQHSIVQQPEVGSVALVIQRNTPDFRAGMMCSEWLIVDQDGKKRSREIKTRMFMPHEVVRMLARVGFVDMELYGSTEGESFSLDSRRCIVIARRP